MLNGVNPQMNQIKALSEVFSKKFVEEMLKSTPLINKMRRLTGNILNLPRAMMATADLSAPLRQGIFFLGRPKQWGPSFGKMFKYALSEKAYQGQMERLSKLPSFKAMKESGLQFTDMGEVLTKREELFQSNLAEKIPVFGIIARGSNRAYSGFLNELRASVFNDLYLKAQKTGALEARPELVRDLARFVNAGTGRGDLGMFERAAVLLNGTLFSPRLLASRLNLINPKFYYKLDPFVRKEALKSLFTFLSIGSTVLTLAKLNGAEVSLDNHNSDFGKIKIGNTRYDIWGGFQQYFVFASRIAPAFIGGGKYVSSTTGKITDLNDPGYKGTTRLDLLQRFLESKESPIASFVTDAFRGKTSFGEDFRIKEEIANMFIPIIANDLKDLVKEGELNALGVIPGVFGVGVQTFNDRIPIIKTEGGKQKVEFRSQPQIGEEVLNWATGKKTPEFTPEEQQIYSEQQKEKSLSNVSKEETKKNAETLYEQIMSKPPEERLQMLQQIEATDPELNEQLHEIHKRSQLTPQETFIKNLGVEDGSRAKFIKKLVDVRKTPKEKVKLLESLSEKGIISGTVDSQLRYLFGATQ